MKDETQFEPATKADLKELAHTTKADLKELAQTTKGDLTKLETVLKGDLNKLGSNLEAKISALTETVTRLAIDGAKTQAAVRLKTPRESARTRIPLQQQPVRAGLLEMVGRTEPRGPASDDHDTHIIFP